ncbi:hypothetical protein RhiJN_25322 [Ceratobasidium sp. AG-Ba]|nr:hypothetical protein RhiJN_25322 [Ceratobasidium sp. AG-Ba]
MRIKPRVATIPKRLLEEVSDHTYTRAGRPSHLHRSPIPLQSSAMNSNLDTSSIIYPTGYCQSMAPGDPVPSQYHLTNYSVDEIPGYTDGYYPASMPSTNPMELPASLQYLPGAKPTTYFPEATTYHTVPSATSGAPGYLPDSSGSAFLDFLNVCQPCPQHIQNAHVTGNTDGNQLNYAPLFIEGNVDMSSNDRSKPVQFDRGMLADYSSNLRPMSTHELSQFILPTGYPTTQSENSIQAPTVPAVVPSYQKMQTYATTHGLSSNGKMNTNFYPEPNSPSSAYDSLYDPITQLLRDDKSCNNSSGPYSAVYSPTLAGAFSGRGSGSTVSARVSPSPRAHPYNPSARRPKTKSADHATGYASSTNSPASSVASSFGSRHTSSASVTSVESSSPAELTGTKATTKSLRKFIKNRRHLVQLLTRYFEQPKEAAGTCKKSSRSEKPSDWLCQWEDPYHMRCSTRKLDEPGELIKKSGRKMGFSSENPAEVLRHMAKHREVEREYIRVCGRNYDPCRRTRWADEEIDAQLERDKASQ